jgi:hypothetical protein
MWRRPIRSEGVFMRNLVFSLFAVALAGVAAIAATTAMLNSPVHSIGAPTTEKKPDGTTPPGTPPAGDRPAPGTIPIPDADKPVPGASKPAEEPGTAKPDASGGAKPAPDASGAAKPADAAGTEEEGEDKDPYEGIAPEDLPPDLQYDADSSVSFPTNT